MTNRHLSEEDIKKARAVDILGFLENNGYEFAKAGPSYVCSSPFSSDSTPSFHVYVNKNIFVDYSTGKKGDAIFLAQELLDIEFPEAVRKLNGTELPVWDKKEWEKKVKEVKPFELSDYLTTTPEDIAKIDKYAESRNISEGYLYGKFWTFATKEGFKKHLAMAFVHEDENGEAVGVKLRNVAPDKNKNKFRAKGKMMFYKRNVGGSYEKKLFIVEGEINAESLRSFFSKRYGSRRTDIISFGGVGNIPEYLPTDYKEIYIVIDYDGDDKLYEERLKRYEKFGGKNIKLELPKGEDINTLWVRGDYETLNKLLR